jgi:hypothetical protein
VDPQRTGGELRVSGADADALPLAGRAVTDLALLDSSVRTRPQPGTFSGERGLRLRGRPGSRGARTRSWWTAWTTTTRSAGTNLDAWFSPQVVREFVVLTHQFAPEFGRASGGVLNLLTERGTNKRVGDAFVQGSDASWNCAWRPGGLAPRTPGSATPSSGLPGRLPHGGPILPDKAFYFFSYEHAGAERSCPTPGVDRDGVQGGHVPGPQAGRRALPAQRRAARSLRFLDGPPLRRRPRAEMVNVGPGLTPETGFRLDESDVQLAASLTSILSPTAVNELRFLVGGSRFDQDANSDRPGVERPSGVFGGNSLNRQQAGREPLPARGQPHLGARPAHLQGGYDVTRSRTTIAVAFHPNGTFLYQTDAPFEARGMQATST